MKMILAALFAVMIGLSFSTATFAQATPATPATPAAPARAAETTSRDTWSAR